MEAAAAQAAGEGVRARLLAALPAEAASFMLGLLEVDPLARLSAAQALAHPFLAQQLCS